jgi:hypothetical protein
LAIFANVFCHVYRVTLVVLWVFSSGPANQHEKHYVIECHQAGYDCGSVILVKRKENRKQKANYDEQE